MKNCIESLIVGLLVSACTASAPSAESPVQRGSVLKANEAGASASQPIGAQGDAKGEKPGAFFSSPIALLPEPVTSFGAAALGDDLYLLGGFSGTPHSYSKEGQHGDLWKLSESTGTWGKLPGVEHLQSVTLTSDARGIVRVGGMRALNTEDEDENLQSLTEVARFNPKNSQWTTLNSLPAPRSSHATVSAGNSIFVVGGWRLFGAKQDHEWHNTMLQCLQDANGNCDWKESKVPFVKRALAVAHANGRLYALGGMNEDGVQGSMFVYDIASGSWSEAAPYPGRPFGIAATSVNGAVVASGADGGVYAYDPAANRWTVAGRVVFPRMFHQMVPTAGGAIVIGGISGLSHKRAVHIEQVSVQAKRAGVVWTVPSEGAAKNRQGIVLAGDLLSLFGGNNSLGQHDFARDNFVKEGMRLNLASLTWEELDPFPRQQQSMTAVFQNDARALLVGGFGFLDDKLTTLGGGYSFDLKTEQWQEHGNVMPEPRTQFGSTQQGDDVWIFGGLSFDNDRKGAERFQHPMSVLRADVSQSKLQFVPSGVELTQARRAFSSERVGQEFFLFGGMKDNFQRVETCEAFSFESKSWRNVACPRAVRIGAEMVEHAGKLYLIAGKSPGANGKLKLDTSIEVYDPEQDAWSVLTEQIPFDTLDHVRALAWRGRLLLISTQREASVAKLALIDPSALQQGASEWVELNSVQDAAHAVVSR